MSNNGAYPWNDVGFDGFDNDWQQMQIYFQNNMEFNSSSSGTFQQGSEAGGVPGVSTANAGFINQAAASAFAMGMTMVGPHNFSSSVQNTTTIWATAMDSTPSYNYFCDMFDMLSIRIHATSLNKFF